MPRMGRLLAVIAIATTFAAVPGARAALAWSPSSSTYYHIRIAKPDTNLPSRCMDVREARTTPNSPVQTWQCGTQWNQAWRFTDYASVNGHWTYRIRPRYLESYCLGILGGSSERGIGAIIRPCDAEWDQRFWLQNSGTGAQNFYLNPVYLPNSLDGNPYSDGSNVLSIPHGDGGIQAWSIVVNY